ncbi:tetratricopeptide repeat protein [Rapidithrix thailandica]|uniref:Tetratricopeptide repeat protein n=1 Tax=Rapidithrix thailandica TaxID=413964 RepID=A0AAW9SFK7_9BACT
MRKLILTFIISLGVLGAAMAQDVKGSVAKAEAYLGKGELKLAKAEIDAAVKKEVDKLESKGKDPIPKAKTLFIKGKVYQAIALSKEEADKSLAEKPLKTAIETYNVILKNEKEGSVYYGYANLQKDQMYGEVFNKGVEFYNNNDMEGALEFFQKASVIKPQDTSVASNVAMIAYELGDRKVVEEYADKLIKMDYKKPYLFNILANYALEEEDYDKALEVIKAGKAANPENMDLLVQEINIYIKTEKTDEAIANIKDALEKDPKNKPLLFNMGILYDRKGEVAKAEEYYKKTLEIDPEYYDAHYSLGALYYNEAVQIYKKINELELDSRGRYKDRETGDTLEAKVKEWYTKSIPYFEKATELNASEKQIFELLSRMYNVLEMKDKYDAVQKKLEAMPEN